jgi:hypothetical protein
MMPTNAHLRIKTVLIFYVNSLFVCGFQFFDNQNKIIWEIGYTNQFLDAKKTVILEDNEVIIGVVAKLVFGLQSAYTDFQFQIAKMN